MNLKYSILFIFFVGVLHNSYADDDWRTLRNDTLDRGIIPDCTFDEKDVGFHIYTGNKPDAILTKQNLMSYEIFKKPVTRKVAFLVHGFTSSIATPNFVEMAKTLAAEKNYLVIGVDWNKAACGASSNPMKFTLYKTAVSNTRRVAKLIAEVIKMITQRNKVSMSNITLIGHSLGAHISGFVGKECQTSNLGKVKEIIGLDPAGPSFADNKCSDRLCVTDAEYVQVIHTSSVLGLDSDIGSVDFYVNNGKSQPDCWVPTCSHTKAIKYLTECIKHECCLIGTPRKNDKSTPKPISQCKRDTCVCVGLNAKSYPAKGPFYVPVEKHPPYCHNEGIKL